MNLFCQVFLCTNPFSGCYHYNQIYWQHYWGNMALLSLHGNSFSWPIYSYLHRNLYSREQHLRLYKWCPKSSNSSTRCGRCQVSYKLIVHLASQAGQPAGKGLTGPWLISQATVCLFTSTANFDLNAQNSTRTRFYSSVKTVTLLLVVRTSCCFIYFYKSLKVYDCPMSGSPVSLLKYSAAGFFFFIKCIANWTRCVFPRKCKNQWFIKDEYMWRASCSDESNEVRWLQWWSVTKHDDFDSFTPFNSMW